MNVNKLGRFYPNCEDPVKADSSSVNGDRQSSQNTEAHGGEFISGLVGTIGTLVQNAVKYHKDQRERQKEIERVQKREDNAYTRAVIDQMRVGIDPRASGSSPSAAGSSSVPIAEMPNADWGSIGNNVGALYQQGQIANQQNELGYAQLAQNERLTTRAQDMQQVQNAYSNLGNMLRIYQDGLDQSSTFALQDKNFYASQKTHLLGYLSEQNNTTSENVESFIKDVNYSITDEVKKVVSSRVSKGAEAHANIGKGNQKKKGEQHSNQQNTGERIRQDLEKFQRKQKKHDSNEKSSSVINGIVDSVLDVVKFNFEASAEGHISWDDLSQEDKDHIFSTALRNVDENSKKYGVSKLRLTDQYKKTVFDQYREFDEGYTKASDEYDNYQDRKENLTRDVFRIIHDSNFTQYVPRTLK